MGNGQTEDQATRTYSLPQKKYLKSELCLQERVKKYRDVVQYAMFRNTAALKKKKKPKQNDNTIHLKVFSEGCRYCSGRTTRKDK